MGDYGTRDCIEDKDNENKRKMDIEDFNNPAAYIVPALRRAVEYFRAMVRVRPGRLFSIFLMFVSLVLIVRFVGLPSINININVSIQLSIKWLEWLPALFFRWPLRAQQLAPSMLAQTFRLCRFPSWLSAVSYCWTWQHRSSANYAIGLQDCQQYRSTFYPLVISGFSVVGLALIIHYITCDDSSVSSHLTSSRPYGSAVAAVDQCLSVVCKIFYGPRRCERRIKGALREVGAYRNWAQVVRRFEYERLLRGERGWEWTTCTCLEKNVADTKDQALLSD